MNRIIALVLMIIFTIAGAAFGDQHSLISLLPGEPLIVMSGTDLGTTYQNLVSLDAVKAHTKSKDREGYDDSKLALKLQDRIREFSDFIGHSIQMQTLLDLAGNNLVLALYDIGSLQFLIVSDLDMTGQASISYLEKFESLDTRKIGDRLYFVKEDPNKGLSFALYRDDNHLIVSNDINRVEGVLLNLESPDGNRFTESDKWMELKNINDSLFDNPLLLYLDMERLKNDRYFRYYWLYRNQDSFDADRSILCGIRVENGDLRERRLILGPKPGKGRGLSAPKLDAAWWSSKGNETTLNHAITDYLGWPFDSEKEIGLKGKLFAVRAQKQKDTEIVHFAKGAAFYIEDGFAKEDLAKSILRGIQDQLLIKKQGLKFADEKGILTLNMIPAMPGAMIAQKGNILFAANDRELLNDLIKSVKESPESTIEAAEVPYRDQLPLWAHSFRQMGPNAAFRDHEIGYFFQGELADLLKAASEIKKYSFESKYSPEGVVIQSVNYEN